MAYDITLEGKNMNRALHLLEGVAKVLDNENVEYWLEGGTLLGVHRENRLLPWDNDVDLSMMVLDDKRMNEIIASIKKVGFRVRLRKFRRDSDFFSTGKLRIIKIRKKYLWGLLKGKVCLEIFVKYQHDNKAYWKIDDKVKNVPIKFYENTKKVDFNNYQYNIPELTDEYLTYRYGDWSTPVKDWNTFADDNAIKK